MELKCKRKDCNREWDYKGLKHYPALVNCPCCGNKVRVPKGDAHDNMQQNV